MRGNEESTSSTKEAAGALRNPKIRRAIFLNNPDAPEMSRFMFVA
jgi:hypothetical protein